MRQLVSQLRSSCPALYHGRVDPWSPRSGTESGLTVPNWGGLPGGLRSGVPLLTPSGQECATMSKSTCGVRGAAGVLYQGKFFPRGSSRNRSCAFRHNTAPSPSRRTSAGMVVIANLSLRARPRAPVASAWSIADHSMVEKYCSEARVSWHCDTRTTSNGRMFLFVSVQWACLHE